MYGYIYETINLINNKKYIGKKKSEIFLENEYLGSGIALNAAIKKYGENNFIVKLLDTAESLKELNEKEKFYIEKFNAVISEDYYNIAKGGDGGIIWGSEENHPSKHTNRAGEKNPFYGKHHSEETRKKISNSNKGKSYNKGLLRIRKDNEIKYIQKNELDNYLKLGYTCYKYEKELEKQKKLLLKFHHSTETKKKISESLKGRIISLESIQKMKNTLSNMSDEKKQLRSAHCRESQKNLCWVVNEKECLRIKKDDLNKYLSLGYIRGRKFKNIL